MTIRDLIQKLQSIPAETVIFARAKFRLYRVAKCNTLRRELNLLSEDEKDGEIFTTKFDGRISEWGADQIGTKEELDS